MKNHNLYPKSLVLGVVIGTLLGVVFVMNYNDSSSAKTALIAQEATTATTSPTPSDNPDLSNAKQQLNQSKQQYENRTNELKNNFKNAKIDLSTLNNLMGQWGQVFQQMESAMSNTSDLQPFWDLNSQFNDMSRDVDEAFQLAYGFSELENNKNQALKEKPKQLKDIERQLKDLKRSSKNIQPPLDTTVLDGYIMQLQSLVTQMQTAANSTNITDPRDLSSTISDFARDFDDISRDFYDTINEINEKVNVQNNLENFKRNLKDKQRIIKDLEREIKRLSKQVQGDKLTELSTAYENIKNILAQIENALNGGDADTAQYLDSDFWDANTDTQDIINGLNEIANQASQGKDVERNLKEKARNIKDMTRECKRNKCENSDAGEKLKEIESIYQQMQEIFKSGDFQSFWDINSEFDMASSEFWDLNGQVNMVKDVQRWLKDTAREIKDKGRWVADLEREAKHGDTPFSPEEVAELQAIYEQMEESAKQAKTAYENGDGKTAQDILSFELNDLRMAFDEITNNFNNKREEEFFGFELENVRVELEKAQGIIPKMLEEGSISEEKADLCLGYIKQGFKFYEELKAIQENGQIGGNEEIQSRFEQLGNKVDRDCGDIFEQFDRPDYEGFTDYYVREDLQSVADEVFNRISTKLEEQLMNKMLDNLGKYTTTVNAMLEQAGQKWQEQLSTAFEAISFVDEAYQEELLNSKNRLFEKIKKMDEMIAMKSQELDRLQEKIANYNFYGDAGDEIEEEMEQFISESDGLTESQIKNKVRELEKRAEESIKKARNQKFEEGVIPFKDTDDHEWFTRYVADVAGKGIVKGYTDSNGNALGEYRPGGLVSVAEALKMALESAGLGEADGRPNQGADHWAGAYLKQAENLGMYIAKGKLDLNRSANRGELIRIILEAADIAPADVSSSSFVDVDSSHPHMKYIEKARELGLVSGDGEKNTFRPNDPVNRAETAKIISNANQLLGEEDEGEEDFED